MSPTWAVDSLHINVRVGDCAIHLLLKLENDFGTIEAAVLVDGGTKEVYNGDGVPKDALVVNPIRAALKDVKARYPNFVIKDWTPQFDAIVVTHWDEDHYGGLVDSFLTDAKDSSLFKDGKFDCLKYTKDGDNYLPATVLYAPNLQGSPPPPPGKKKSGYYNGLPETLRYDPATGFVLLMPSAGAPIPFAIFKHAGDAKAKPDAFGSIWTVLGVNFFNNQPLPSVPASMLPADLLKQNPPWTGQPADDGRPGLYCVAVQQQTFPVPKSPLIIKEQITKTNKVSIAACIMWGGAAGPIRVSHYFAGDMDETNELKVVKWLQAGKIDRVPSVKLSHHGSRSSTPIAKEGTLYKTMFEYLRPANIIISNPGGKYFHPGWEPVYTVKLASRLSDREEYPPLIFATKYPFYFAKNDKDEYDVFIRDATKLEQYRMFKTTTFDEAKNPKKKQMQPFLNYCAQAYATFATRPGAASESTEYDRWLAQKNEAAQNQFVLDLLGQYWQQCALPVDNSFPRGVSAVTWPRLQRLGTVNAVMYVVIRSKYGDVDLSGNIVNTAVAYRYFGDWQVLRAARPKKAPATASSSSTSSTGANKVGASSAASSAVAAPATAVKTGSLDAIMDVGSNPNERNDEGDDPDDDDGSGGSDGALATSASGLTPSLPSGPGPALPPGTSPPTASDQGWYFYWSDLPDDQIRIFTQDYTKLSANPDLDALVGSFHYKVIQVSLQSSRFGVTDSTTCPLQTSDEWNCWMQDCLQAQELNASVTTGSTPGDKQVSGFQFQVPVPKTTSASAAPASTSGTSASPAVLLFSTAPDVLKETFPVTTLPVMGLLGDPNAIAFGLDLNSSNLDSLTLTDIVHWLDLDHLFGSSVLNALAKLPFKLPSTSGPKGPRRNAVWFEPESDYRTTVRLELDLDLSFQSIIQNYIPFLKNISITDGYVIARKISWWTAGSSTISVQASSSVVIGMSFDLEGVVFDTILELQADTMKATLRLNTKQSDPITALETMLSWIIKNFGLSGTFDFTKYTGQQASSASVGHFLLREITIEMQHDDQKNTAKLISFRVDMEVNVTSGNNPVIFLVTYTYTPGEGSVIQGSTVEADLWLAPVFDTKAEALRLLPDFEDYAFYSPASLATGQTWPTYLDLTAIGGLDDIPNQIPTQVTQAMVRISAEGLAFSGTVKAKDATGAQVPVFAIDEVDLVVFYGWKSSSQPGFVAYFGFQCLLQAPIDSIYNVEAELSGSVAYNNGAWALKASVKDLYCANLCQFFDSTIQAAIMPLIESIEIQSLDVAYTYAKGGVSSTFSINGVVNVGQLQFNLNFNHDANGWEFFADAELAQNPSSTTLGEVLTSVMGPVDMPSFISQVSITMSKSEDKLGFRMLPIKGDNGTVSTLFFTVFLEFDGFRIQIIQTKGNGDDGKLQRIFLVSLDSIPSVSIPLVGDITQPFDEALFLWVQPQTTSTGLTLGDVNLINKQLKDPLLNQKPLMWKAVKTKTADTDVVILNGAHLMLILNDDRGTPQVVLDYVFDQNKPQGTAPESSTPSSTAVVHVNAADDPAPTPSTGDSGPSMAQYEKSFGPLAVKNIGFNYTSKPDGTSVVSVKVDASITLGPIAFELLGFSLDLEFTKDPTTGKFFNLQNLPSPAVSLDGLGGSYDRAPVEMAGAFEHGETPDGKTEFYEGAIVISWIPWTFEAAGYYGQTGGDQSFTSAFIYCMLEGPILTLEFAEITGITGGFGYNTALTFPSISNVQSFPFLDVPKPIPAPTGTGPLGALNALLAGPWFSTKKDSFWVAAGLTVTAFEMLTVIAVVTVEWDPAVKLGIFGIVTGDIPPNSGNEPKFAHIQFGIVATVDFGAGVMKIDGQLTPSSYIYSPDCHLTGGFALYSWFNSKDDSLRGDWVFTIGGYHQQFHPPPQYPNPPRLAISWQFDDDISIRGEAYFAITPKVCMGGGRLDVSLSVGVLEAWFDAYADFLINFKPFHFLAEGGLSVGVTFTLDLWIVTIHISVEIGASLFIAGPPMYGTVHVDFWVFGFDVNFGSNDGTDTALSLEDFISLACQADLKTSNPMMGLLTSRSPARVEEVTDEEEDALVPHVFACTSGLFPQNNSKSTPSGQKWYVRAATFSFTVSCKVAIDSAEIRTMLPEAKLSDPPEFVDPVPGTGTSIYAKPMGMNAAKPGDTEPEPISSTLRVSITPEKATTPLPLLAMAADDNEVPKWTQNTPVNKNLPAALWSKYNPLADPSYNMNNSDLLNSQTGKTVYLMCGVSINKPDPALSDKDTMPAFNVQKSQIQDVGTPHPLFPGTEPDPKTFLPDQPDESPDSKQWTNVAAAWKTPRMGAGVAELAVLTWINDVALPVLGWDPKKMDPTKNQVITGDVPKHLVDNLSTYYLWAPDLSIPILPPTPTPPPPPPTLPPQPRASANVSVRG